MNYTPKQNHRSSTTTQTQQINSGISIGSKHFIDQLESIIIQIARSLSIELQIPVDPDAKEMTRQIVQTRINTLLSKLSTEEIKRINTELDKTIKTTKDPNIKKIAIEMYHLLKLMALDNV